jgi:molybdate transport system substrate-binding protein
VRVRAGLALVLLGASVAACSTASTSAAPNSLTVYAAASLKGVLEKVEDAYKAANPGASLTISADSSAALETKLEQGAHADLFLSADTSNPQRLVDRGLASGATVTFARNELTIIVPAANPGSIASPADLARPGVKVIAAEDTAPISKYALQLVTNLAKLPAYPTGYAAAYVSNVVSKEDNVAGIVSKVELGEGDAGIVYATDARASTKVTSIDVPDSANVPATYAAVVLRSSPNQASAAALLTWLTSADGRTIFESFGFLPPS